MIGERAFYPLKGLQKLPESSKQAETALAWFQTILSNLPTRAARPIGSTAESTRAG
jgi:hypothetical protein